MNYRYTSALLFPFSAGLAFFALGAFYKIWYNTSGPHSLRLIITHLMNMNMFATEEKYSFQFKDMNWFH